MACFHPQEAIDGICCPLLRVDQVSDAGGRTQLRVVRHQGRGKDLTSVCRHHLQEWRRQRRHNSNLRCRPLSLAVGPQMPPPCHLWPLPLALVEVTLQGKALR